ncbi:regulatory protein, arsR family [Lentzea fradiae]|uniref:Regulatory protein, arsR family n=1 Tax=Lentzea fradiae TaxID=200378 RepID=A0A1G7KAX6_9PSEU|nr:ArsR family transcriptional regulator [Lentzea fradiae]SDF34296.1 regulatory protein, arsR family [Lentzea fradiae]
MPIVLSESASRGRGLTILFELEDLARTRFAPAPLPMYELVFAMHRGDWDRLLLPRIRPLAELVRPGRFVPDFFDSARPDFDEAVREVLDVPATRVRDQIVSMLGTTSPWLRSYAAGTPASRQELRSALTTAFRELLAPNWARTRQAFDAEVRLRSAQAVSRGLGDLLGHLHPSISWTPPALHVELAWEAEISLRGTGMLVVPVLNGLTRPAVSMFAEPQPLLFYPVTAPQPSGGSLELALGRTRTLVLRALTSERTTTELARHVGISLPTASQHATALRTAGFVSTHRNGRSVRHRLTRRGWELLN